MSDNPEIKIDKVHGEDSSQSMRHKKRKKSYCLADDMLLAFLVTFAAAVAGYSENVPDTLRIVYSVSMTVVFALVWFGLSLYSGIKGKWKFILFTALFWIIPVICIALYDSGAAGFGLSVTMYVLSEFFRLLVIDSTQPIISIIGLEGVLSPIIFLLLNLLFFFGGIVFVVLQKTEDPDEVD